MKAISAELKAHLAQTYQRLSTCWKITLQDATVKAFCDHDQNIVFDGVTYLASSGYVASDVMSSDALNVDNLDVQGMLESPSITDEELRSGRWDRAYFEIFMVNWSDLTQGRLIQRCGTLGEVSIARSQFVAELRGLLQAYTSMLVEVYSPACRASLGDARCKVDLYPLTVASTIESVRDDNMTIFDSARTEPGPVDTTSPINLLQHGGGGASLIFEAGTFPTIVNGSPVSIHGMTGDNEPLNGVWAARNVLRSDSDVLSFQIDEDNFPGGTQSAPVGTVTILGLSSGYFDHGVLTITFSVTPIKIGLSMEVKQYSPGQIVLSLPFPFALEVGDEYSMTPGCDKQLATCRDKFANVVNMRAESYLAGNDKLLQIGRRG